MNKENLIKTLQEKLKISRYALRNFAKMKGIKEKIIEYTHFLDNNVPMNVRSWHLINGIESIGICKQCKINATKFNNNKWGYLDYCSVKCQRNSETVCEKLSEAIQKKYGEGIVNPFQATEVKERIKNTMLKKYGVDHNLKSQQVKDKIKTNNIEKYGVENYVQTDEYRKKYRKKMLERYGVEHFSQTNEFKNSARKTFLRRYGVEHPMKNAEFVENVLRKIHKFKDFTLPSGSIVKLQGYETYALTKLLEKYDESEIIFSKKEICKKVGFIEYFDFNNVKRTYFPDFYIEKENLLIEVKSVWTFDKNGRLPENQNINFLKRDACINKGFKFKFLIIKIIKDTIELVWMD